MGKSAKTYHLILVAALGAAAVSACAPSYKMSAYDTSMDAGYGYAQSAYGYSYETQSTATYSSRYGGELRGGCQIEVQSCGFMTVVPVYPVYQIVTPPPVPEVPVVEVPQVVEPDPIPYVEPTPYVEPVYQPPVHHWPEPETPPPVWTPLRK